MSSRELDIVTTPAGGEAAPLTRREARELEARAAASASVARETVSAPAAVSRPARGPRLTKPRAVKSWSAKPAASKTRPASKLLSLGAMIGAAAILVGMSVPANAFMSANAFAPLTIETQKLEGQHLDVSDDAAMAPLSRDTFDVISYADQLRLKYANVSYSFTATTGAIRWPFPYSVPITDGFGDRPAGTSGTSHHNGVDFVPGGGTPIYAVADGVVSVHSDDAGGYGNHVILSHNIDGNAFDSLYAHMQTGSSPLNAGDTIKAGDFIGLVGDTGDSYGAHLHFEIRINNVPVDPFAWLQANATN